MSLLKTGVLKTPFCQTKKLARNLLETFPQGEMLVEAYRRDQRVRQLRCYLEVGDIYPAEREAILCDFGAVCMNAQLHGAGIFNLEFVAREIIARGVEGVFVECGTWRGGSLGLWARTFMRNGGDVARCPIFGFPRERVTITKGWFQDTLPLKTEAIGKIAVLRLDGDFSESTKFCLEKLYDQVVSGDTVIIDDYGVFPGCLRAVDEFIAARSCRCGSSTSMSPCTFSSSPEGPRINSKLN